MRLAAESRPLVIGHRGASGYRPEHSRSAYELALDLGAEALEPDLVASRDGVLVLRHENEISSTTDIAERPQFAGRRRVKVIDGKRLDGWFIEDFDWAELATLRVRERFPAVRPDSAAHDGLERMLRLTDLIALVREAQGRLGRSIHLALELKHASYFDRVGLPLDRLLLAELAAAEGSIPLIVESFELPVLLRLREAGLPAHYVFLAENSGAPADEVLAHGANARRYDDFLSDTGLAELAEQVHGVSVDKKRIMDAAATQPAPHAVVETHSSALVRRIHDAGLTAFAWTLRPENRFLAPSFRSGAGKNEYGNWLAEFRAIMATGLEGVFVDHPDLALRARIALNDGATESAFPAQ